MSSSGYFFPTTVVDITRLNGTDSGSVKSTDTYPAVDITDVTQSPSGTTKHYQINQLITFILSSLGLHTYIPCLAASTANLNATYSNGVSGVGATLTNAGTKEAFILDGQTGVSGGRYLIKDQTTQYQTGIYTLTTLGDTSTNWVLTRAADFNSSSNIINGGIVYIIKGTQNYNTIWQDTFTTPLTVGTTSILWSEYNITPTPPDPEYTWSTITDSSVNALVDNGYITDRPATPVQVLLPPVFEIGDPVIVLGSGNGGWSLVANSGQTIKFGSASTSVGGSINSDIQYSNIIVRGLVANTTWTVESVNSNPTYT